MWSERSTIIEIIQWLWSESFEDELATEAHMRETNEGYNRSELGLRKRTGERKRPRTQPCGESYGGRRAEACKTVSLRQPSFTSLSRRMVRERGPDAIPASNLPRTANDVAWEVGPCGRGTGDLSAETRPRSGLETLRA
jgi:hypothetical protein